METESKFDKTAVYVKAVPVSELDEEMREGLGDVDFVYAVCNSHGTPLAIADGEHLARRFAKENNLQTHSLN